eukprot:5489222-Prymnesium_polylepis.2
MQDTWHFAFAMDKVAVSAGLAAAGAAVAYVLLNRAPPYKSKYTAEWDKVEKNEKNRVDRAAFVKFCLAKNAALLTPGSKASYEKFLNKCFDAATGLMLPAEKADLGRHCFSYAALFADEFYFAAAQNAADAGCGCNTPVADTLGLTK